MAAFVVVLLVSIENSFFGPIDTYPRLYKTARCPNSEWASVAVYRKKAYWFFMDTDIWVKVSDSRGNVVHEERLQQFDMWHDVAAYMHGEAPAGFCNKASITKGA